jgi:hypothetical protein
VKKAKKIWSWSTAAHIAAMREAKYGYPFEVIPMEGGGFEVIGRPDIAEAELVAFTAEAA